MFYILFLVKNNTKFEETNIDITNNSTNIYTIGVLIDHFETFINQTSTTHLNIFLVIFGVSIILVLVLILVLCNKLISTKNFYTSTLTHVSN